MQNVVSFFAQVRNCTDQSLNDAQTCFTNLPQPALDNNNLKVALSIIFGVIAAVAVILIILQGIRFILSSGDPQKAADARKGIIYAVVGLAVALSAEVVVRLVIGKI